jgi:hypothetical protein
MACSRYYEYQCKGGNCRKCWHNDISLAWTIALGLFAGSILGLLLGLAATL